MDMDFTVEYDVVVVGGGIAGVAAAMQAARSGKRTAIVEKNVLLGGLATSGLVYIYLPLCDGFGHQTTFGIAEELLRRSMDYGPGKIPENWRNEANAPESKRLMCRFSPASFMLTLEEILDAEGVDIWYDTLVCDAQVENDRLAAIVVQNESGRGRMTAKCFVDASGNSIVLRRAGVPCLTDDNYLTIWALQYQSDVQGGDFGDKLMCQVMTTSSLDQETKLQAPMELMQRMYGEMTPEGYHQEITYRGLTGSSVSRFTRESHRLLREMILMRREATGVSRNDDYPVKLPLMPQFRKTYCIEGEYILNTGENGKVFADSIGLVGDWRRAGTHLIWEIPYGTMIPKNHLGGILAAGRCTAAQGDAWEITRVIPTAAMTGQVAGLAAAMAIDAGVEPWQLPVEKLQQELRRLGFPLHKSEINL